jgi:hypothetical protein
MKVNRLDGKPRVGTSYGTLGVRPPGRGVGLVADIQVDANGNVQPGTDGLSTFDTQLPPDKTHAVWVIDSEEISASLTVIESLDTPGRWHITPGREMPLSEYQDLLADTRDLWEQV